MDSTLPQKTYWCLPLLLLSFSSVAEPSENQPALITAVPSPESKTSHINVPTLNDAAVFARYTDKLPAVVNYFTSASENKIIDFYQQHYGTALNKVRKRKRLTLMFSTTANDVRVVISLQNNKRQVDVMLTEQKLQK